GADVVVEFWWFPSERSTTLSNGGFGWATCLPTISVKKVAAMRLDTDLTVLRMVGERALFKFLKIGQRLQPTNVQVAAMWGIAATIDALWLIQSSPWNKYSMSHWSYYGNHEVQGYSYENSYGSYGYADGIDCYNPDGLPIIHRMTC
ncbi:hypothetical protein Godav_004544, partial [Gossypium davidsonii]|nr:hypothetical protein [Gossypium davidsonii]MBA0662614.1 hypothetical protein [Gossypium klotzschianum]